MIIFEYLDIYQLAAHWSHQYPLTMFCRTIVQLLVACSIPVVAFAQQAPELYTQRCFGGSFVDQGSEVMQLADGRILCLAYTSSSNGDPGPSLGNGDAWLLHCTPAGSIQEQWRFGGSQYDSGRAMVEMADGGVAIVGHSQSIDGNVGQNQGGSDVWVLRLDAEGNVLWYHTFGGSGYELANAVCQTEDGGVLVVGETNSTNGDILDPLGGLDAWVLCLSASGELLWRHNFGGSLDDVGRSVVATDDGGFVVGGISLSTTGHVPGNQGGSDAWLFKLDADGEVLWHRTYGGSGDDGVRSMCSSENGGFVCAGYTSSNNGNVSGFHGGFTDVWVFEVDAEGELLNQRCLGGSAGDDGKSILSVPSGGYAVAASTNSTNGDVGQVNGSYDYWLVRLNNDFELVWETTFGGAGNESVSGLAVLTDGSYALYGSTSPSSNNTGDVSGYHGGPFDAWLVITEPEAVSVAEHVGGEVLQLAYDQIGSALLIQNVEALSGMVTVAIHSATGALMESQVAPGSPVGRSIRVDLAGLAPGQYVVTLTSQNGRRAGRFVRW